MTYIEQFEAELAKKLAGGLRTSHRVKDALIALAIKGGGAGFTIEPYKD